MWCVFLWFCILKRELSAAQPDVKTSLFWSHFCLSTFLSIFPPLFKTRNLTLLKRERSAARLDVKTSLFRVSSDCDPVQDPTFGPASAILHSGAVVIQPVATFAQWRKVQQVWPCARPNIWAGLCDIQQWCYAVVLWRRLKKHSGEKSKKWNSVLV